MRRQMTSFALIVCGSLAMALGLTVAPAPAAAMPALQPSPRPTLVPTPDFRPDEGDAGDGGDNEDGSAVAYGRVTGTVIDARTSAPAPNILVVVGETLLATDANGNYDHWAPVGIYPLRLQLRPGEGDPAQGVLEVAITAQGTTVQHLYFTSQAPTAVPTEPPPPTPTVAPTVVAAMPPALPDTSVEEVEAGSPSDLVPTTLPRTALTAMRVPGPLVLVGAVLLALGVLLQVRPRRRTMRQAEADRRMLRRLLAQDPGRDDGER